MGFSYLSIEDYIVRMINMGGTVLGEDVSHMRSTEKISMQIYLEITSSRLASL